jgi:hypothetical protein
MNQAVSMLLVAAKKRRGLVKTEFLGWGGALKAFCSGMEKSEEW